MSIKIVELEIFGIMNKEDVLNILREMNDNIEQMTNDELFSLLMSSSKTFRKEIDKIEQSSKIQEINFIFNRYKNDMSPGLISMLKKRKKALKKSLDDKYEV